LLVGAVLALMVGTTLLVVGVVGVGRHVDAGPGAGADRIRCASRATWTRS
jgi:hypothetical protein